MRGLTAVQYEVARRCAAGETSRQVGLAMFMAPSSVRTVLSETYTKLGIEHNRDALREFLEGIGDPEERIREFEREHGSPEGAGDVLLLLGF
ncbi:MAG TPA: LuxR C-terminal-related transcriptional regulator [Terriglobia bacterium]|nr:LuxR C-terminal-related transcriptional regulator [Terriglobia bacterium]